MFPQVMQFDELFLNLFVYRLLHALVLLIGTGVGVFTIGDGSVPILPFISIIASWLWPVIGLLLHTLVLWDFSHAFVGCVDNRWARMARAQNVPF